MRPTFAPTVALTVAPAVAAGSCATGLHLIVARGTSEPKGAGIAGLLADRVAERVGGSAVAPLDYPATMTNPEYDESVGDGVEALHKAVRAYARACPGSKLALLGYSQGAQLTMDALCDSSGIGFASHEPLPADVVRKNVVAIVLFGDPTHVAGTRYDEGTSVQNGVFERTNASVAVCEAYADRLVSYCDKGDVYCDAGADRLVHGRYMMRYGDDALDFVVERYDKAARGNDTSSSTKSGADPAEPTASGAHPAAATTPSSTTSAASALVAGGSVRLGLALIVAAAVHLL